jgi:hypothetical protein
MGNKEENENWKQDYKIVLEGRRHEIDLFWKRSNIFWLLTAAAFAAFYKTVTEEKSEIHIYAVLIANIGLFCSFCWTLVNRGSKFWMTCWELWTSEYGADCFSGSHSSIKKGWWVHRFSVSKLMIIISDFFTLVWVFLIFYLYYSKVLNICPSGLIDFITPITIVCLIIVLFISHGDDDKGIEPEVETPTFAEVIKTIDRPQDFAAVTFNKYINGSEITTDMENVLRELKESKYRDRSIGGLSKAAFVERQKVTLIMLAFVKMEIVIQVQWYGKFFYRLTETGKEIKA